ncbi:MAG: sialidase family protein [Janthinobacterium lividum]
MKKLLYQLSAGAGVVLALASSAAAQTQLDPSRPTYYPRVIRLGQGSQAGRLLASFDAGKAGAIYESPDNGRTWQHLSDVLEKTPPSMCCSGLYELPARQGDTPAGALLWATSVGTDKGGRGPCSIRLHRSLDGGHTWAYFSTPVSGFIGLWEPEFLLDAQGRLVVYYSSEEHKAEGYNQLLAHKTSTDGGLTWSPETIDVGKADGKLRPGMAVVRRLPSGQYLMSYEICGLGCDAYLRTSPDGVSWGDPADNGQRIESTAGNHFAHAPTVAWAPQKGNPNGQVLAIGQMLLNNTDNAVAPANGKVYMMNTQNGQGPWTEVPAPVPVPGAKDNPCPNYSSQLLPAADGLTVLEIALDFVDGRCQAFYQTAALPTPAGAPAKPSTRRKAK